MEEFYNGNKSNARPMINLWRIIRYIFDLISHFIWKPKAVAENSVTEDCTKSNPDICDKIPSKTKENKEYDCIKINKAIDELENPVCKQRKSAYQSEFLNKNKSGENVLKKRIIQETSHKDLENRYCILKETTVEIMMKRNYVRRNSKRFVIGDGEDDETISEIPDIRVTGTEDIKVTGTQDEQMPKTWNKENSFGRLALRSSLT